MSQTDEPQADSTEAKSQPEFDRQTIRRLKRGAYDYTSKDCGPPTRSPAGEWMERIAFDLPEAMHEALVERARSNNGARIGEVIRAALAAAGIGESSHVPGICDGTYSDDAERAAAETEHAEMRARIREGLHAQRAARTRRVEPVAPPVEL